jgi:pyruvate dehydrogenase E2 component (dihydrolipoamide acetyltransferase)
LRAVGGGEPSGAEPSHGPGTAEVGRPKASPLARRLAAEAGIELSGLSGSGPHGRVTRGDVERALAGGSPSHDGGEAGADSAVAAAHEAAVAATAAGAVAAPAESLAGEAAESLSSAPAEAPPEAAAPRTAAKGATTVQEPSRLQQTVARRMAESRATVPDLELRREVDMSQVVALREQLREVSDPLPSINDFIVKAVALALREFPRVNGAYRDARFESYARVNVGIAVAARDALVVPTIFDADRKRLSEIAEASRTLAGRVRDGSVAPAELAGGTFTVSNLGMYGIDSFSAVINPPQAAILAVGAMRPRPVVDESGAVVARPTVMFTLACDHRILYGADGAQFLARVCELLGRPIALLAN